jgi:hypothetical protein
MRRGRICSASQVMFYALSLAFQPHGGESVGGEATRSGASRGHVIYGKQQHAAMRFCGGILRGSKCHNMEGTSPPSGSLYDQLLMREILYKTVRSGYIPPEMRPAVRHLGLLLLDLRHHVMGGDNDPLIPSIQQPYRPYRTGEETWDMLRWRYNL